GARVAEQAGRIEPGARPARTAHPPPVTEGGRQPADADVPVVAGAVLLGVEGELGERGVAATLGQDDEGDAGAVPAEEGEVVPVGVVGDAEREGPAAAGGERGHRGRVLGRAGPTPGYGYAPPPPRQPAASL